MEVHGVVRQRRSELPARCQLAPRAGHYHAQCRPARKQTQCFDHDLYAGGDAHVAAIDKEELFIANPD